MFDAEEVTEEMDPTAATESEEAPVIRRSSSGFTLSPRMMALLGQLLVTAVAAGGSSAFVVSTNSAANGEAERQAAKQQAVQMALVQQELAQLRTQSEETASQVIAMGERLTATNDDRWRRADAVNAHSEMRGEYRSLAKECQEEITGLELRVRQLEIRTPKR